MLSVMAAKNDSLLLAGLMGMFLTWTVISSHNFFHQKDNWRMKLFNLSMMSYREWRISHGLSHHIYPNTLHDVEMSFFEPFLPWLPSQNVKPKGIFKYFSWAITPIVYGVIYFAEPIRRLIATSISKQKMFFLDDIIVPLLVPTVMVLLGNQKIDVVLKLWLFGIWIGSTLFAVIGLNAAHHHPEVVHEGDAHK